MKYKLSSIAFISMISVAVLFSAALIYNMVTVSKIHASKAEKELRLIFIKRQKEAIAHEINRLINRIHTERHEVISNANKSLRHRVDSIFDFISDYNVKRQSVNSLRSRLQYFMDNEHWEYSTGYFFALDKDGNIIFNGRNHELEGQNVTNSIFGSDIKAFTNKVYKSGSAFGQYGYNKQGDDSKLIKKFAYARYDKKTGLLIGACIYENEIDKIAQGVVLNDIKNDKYGFQNSGYFMVFSPQYKTIYHPSVDFSRADLKLLKDSNGNYFIRNAVKIAQNGGGFISYKWREPGTNIISDKMSYVKYIKDWNWIIGTGFYFTSFNELALSEQRVMTSSIKQDLYSNVLLIIVLLGLTVIVAFYIVYRLKKIEDGQVKIINDLEQYKHVMDQTSVISMTDPTGHITYVNDKFCEITGHTREFLIGKKHSVMRHPDTPNELFKDLWTTISKGNIWRGIIKNLRADGSHFYHKVTIIPYKNEFGNITHYTSCSQDITELIENREKLQNVFTTDRLTGLGNRYKLLSDLSSAKMPALAFVDIDRFHEINELYGMQRGDDLLKIISEKLLSQPDMPIFNLYRLHSDVFAIMAPYIDFDSFREKISNCIKNITKEVYILDNKEIYLTFRTGFSGDKTDTAVKADIALQLAKSQNIDNVVYDINSINNAESYEQNIKIIKLINNAFDNDNIMPFYQPIYNLDTGVIDKYECLIRIIGEDGSIIPPAQFLDVSKRTRVYPKLTQIVAKKAIDTFKNLDKEFSINLSVEDLMNKSTIEYIYQHAMESGVISRLCIELLETEQLSCSNEIVDTIGKFKQAGAKIAIDDFGTGYSNFDYLLKIQADYIKIDGSIIKLITKDDRAVDIVNSIVRYAKKMGLKTIGEFTSDRDIALKAKNLRIDYAQGYYFGKPEKTPAEKPDNQL